MSLMTIKRPAEVDDKIYDKFADEAFRRLDMKGEPIKTALDQAMQSWLKNHQIPPYPPNKSDWLGSLESINLSWFSIPLLHILDDTTHHILNFFFVNHEIFFLYKIV
jgi:hypothetical protein